MENKLKQYYSYIIESDGVKVRRKHDNHHAFRNEVNNIKELIKSGNDSWKQNQGFLEMLLYTKDNGIANIGYSQIHFSYDVFLKLIISDNFMSALGELIYDPTCDTHHRFAQAWVEQQEFIPGLNHNAVVINRVAAASTLDVSTTVDMPKFEKAFHWLITEKMIPKYYPNKDKNNECQGAESREWFVRNQFLMKEIKKQFQDELKNGDTDEVYLSHFVWYLYKCRKGFIG